MARTAAQRLGDDAEALVAARLEATGWTILGRRVRVGRGELDIVAVDPGPPAHLVAVEVRWRADRGFGLPEETFDRRKQRRVRTAIVAAAALGRLSDGTALPRLPLRVDLVAVEPPERAGQAARVRHHRDTVAD